MFDFLVESTPAQPLCFGREAAPAGPTLLSLSSVARGSNSLYRHFRCQLTMHAGGRAANVADWARKGVLGLTKAGRASSSCNGGHRGRSEVPGPPSTGC